jgi:GT2 family glycosyltransferase
VTDASVGIVVIGRNEGDRLVRCLQSLPQSARVVYVDSGSTDGSLERARALGFEALPLSSDAPFSAARARNAGFQFLVSGPSGPDYVQLVDGDCELDAAWIGHAVSALATEPTLAIVFGRCRERYPNASVYNALCDDEWDGPVGLVESCGGIAMVRRTAFDDVGGFNETLIAGEEPDLCLRLSRKKWSVRRIAAEMNFHDAAMTKFKQWWVRTRRSGFAYAEHVMIHRHHSNPSWIRSLISILFWAAAIPALILGAVCLSIVTDRPSFTLFGLGLLLLYPVQWLRMALRKRRLGATASFSRYYATLTLAGKFAQLGGIVRAAVRYSLKGQMKLIEYRDGT